MVLVFIPPFRFAIVNCTTNSNNDDNDINQRLIETQDKQDDETVYSSLPDDDEEDNNALEEEVENSKKKKDTIIGDNYNSTENKNETIYRGAYPSLRNFRFLKSLQLKTLISIVNGGKSGVTRDLYDFCKYEKINHIIVSINKETKIPTADSIRKVVSILINPDHLPVYIHCSDGGIGCGVCIMCLRVVQGWSMEGIIKEYSRYVKDGSVSSNVHHQVSSFSSAEVFDNNERNVSWLKHY